MTEQWKTAAIGAFGGAILSLAIVFGAAATGTLPGVGDRAIHDYLLRNPEILQQAQEALNTKLQQSDADDARASQAAIDKLGPGAFFNPRLAFITGPADAKTTVVEFFDYNCPYCRASLPTVRKFYESHKDDVRFAFIEFPIKGDESVLATRALLAARKQPGKYVPFHFALMNQGDTLVTQATIDAVASSLGIDLGKLHADMNDPGIAHSIAASNLLARHARINGTPTFIVNGNVHAGALEDDELASLLKKPKRG